jgi:serine/threonine-protein kinase
MDSFEELRRALEDHYRVEREVGRGGMATVYAAHDLKHDRRVAIKLLSPELAATIGADRFAREIRIAARLSHPGIVTVFDSGQVSGLFYYVMPFVEGESLRDRLVREKQLSIDDAITIACEVADALMYAHDHGVVHRDIKPENILLQSGRALVADFGIARAEAGGGQALTVTGSAVGTAAYMSPEQASGSAVDARTDIYALGCTLYEMLAGEPPFSGANSFAVMAKHALEPVPSIRVVRASVPVEVESAVLQALEKVPADRFQTMERFKASILGEVAPRISRGTPSRSARYSGRYSAPEPAVWWRRRATLIAAGITAVAAVAGSAIFARTHAGQRAPSVDANRVAVLYFDDRSTGSLRYLADALTESLIDRLSSVSILDVVSANGVRPFRGRDVAMDSIGRALKVGSIVRGAVEPMGPKVRVSVSLVDAASNADIARKSIDLDTSRVLSQQDEVATQVAAFLRQHVGDEVRLRSDRTETSSDRAWTLVERANKLRKDADSLTASRASAAALSALTGADSLLREAAAADPRWGRPLALLATVSVARAALLGKNTAMMAAVIDSGLASARNAIALRSNDADAYEARGKLEYLRYIYHLIADPRLSDRTLATAESSLTRAVALNRNQVGAWVTLSILAYNKPDLQASNIAALNAYRADTYLTSANAVLRRLFWTSYDLEQFPEALKWCDEWHRRFPSDPETIECRLWMYTTPVAKADVDSAWAYYAQYVSRASADSQQHAFLAKKGQVIVAGATARAGLADSARAVLIRARAAPQLDPHRELEGWEAAMRVMIGDEADRDTAVRLITDYLTVNPEHRRGFATRIHWWWRGLQNNPQFKALLAGAQ